MFSEFRVSGLADVVLRDELPVICGENGALASSSSSSSVSRNLLFDTDVCIHAQI